MDESLTLEQLADENDRYRATAGVSQGGRSLGFAPAFFDRATCIVYPSRYADGRLAPFHLLDGLPAELVVRRNRQGRAVGVKASVVCGFVRCGRFFTREQAAEAAPSR